MPTRFSIENPIAELVTFTDVVQLQHLDKDAFLAEYDAYHANGGVLPEGSEPTCTGCGL